MLAPLLPGVVTAQTKAGPAAQTGSSEVQVVAAAAKLPVIKADSKIVSIRDGDFFDRDAWKLSPSARPDVYTADRTRKTKWVTFYTDMDSIRVRVKPGGRYDFVILLNGKDSCFTRIVSAIPPAGVTANDVGPNDKTDTIPFTLTEYNAIAAQAVLDGTDTVTLHFDVGSFNFHLTKDAVLRKASRKNVSSLQMGTRVWQKPSVGVTGFTAHNMDGRFGWDLFEGRQVEIDYDHNLLIIHPRLPRGLKGYVRERLLFQRSYVCVKAAFATGEGCFMLDTGSDQAVIVDSGWAAEHRFTDGLKLIKTTVLKDPRGNQYQTRTVEAPVLGLGQIRLPNVPTLVLSGRNPVGFELNYLGNDLLKRFNIILDFQHDYIYLKPNRWMGAPYRANS